MLATRLPIDRQAPWSYRPHRRALALATGLLCLAGLTGCDCPDGTAVYPIGEADYASLERRYGDDALPRYECERLCLDREPDPADCGQGGGAASCDTRTPYATVGDCMLALIEGVEPAVVCRGAQPCDR